MTRLKTGVKYEILPENGVRKSKKCECILNDEYEIVRDEKIETKREIELLTDMFELDATDVALIYKKRWEVELYFTMLKQNLKDTLINSIKNAIIQT